MTEQVKDAQSGHIYNSIEIDNATSEARGLACGATSKAASEVIDNTITVSKPILLLSKLPEMLSTMARGPATLQLKLAGLLSILLVKLMEILSTTA